MSEYENPNSTIGNVKDPVFRVILTRKIHLEILMQ